LEIDAATIALRTFLIASYHLDDGSWNDVPTSKTSINNVERKKIKQKSRN